MGTTTCRKVQFNPNTLKVLYNPDTKKVQAINYTMTCEHCDNGTQPYRINAALSDFVDTGCCRAGAEGWAEEFYNLAGSLNSNTFPLSLSGTCKYQYYGVVNSPNEWGNHINWTSPDCSSGRGFEHDWDVLWIDLTITETGVNVQIDVADSIGESWRTVVFCGSTTVECGEINSTVVTNDIAACWDEDCSIGGNWYHPCAETGTVTLTGLYCST